MARKRRPRHEPMDLVEFLRLCAVRPLGVVLMSYARRDGSPQVTRYSVQERRYDEALGCLELRSIPWDGAQPTLRGGDFADVDPREGWGVRWLNGHEGVTHPDTVVVDHDPRGRPDLERRANVFVCAPEGT